MTLEEQAGLLRASHERLIRGLKACAQEGCFHRREASHGGRGSCPCLNRWLHRVPVPSPPGRRWGPRLSILWRASVQGSRELRRAPRPGPHPSRTLLRSHRGGDREDEEKRQRNTMRSRNKAPACAGVGVPQRGLEGSLPDGGGKAGRWVHRAGPANPSYVGALHVRTET